MKCYEIRLRDAGPEVPDDVIEARVDYLADTINHCGGKVSGRLYLGAAVTARMSEEDAAFHRRYFDVIEA